LFDELQTKIVYYYSKSSEVWNNVAPFVKTLYSFLLVFFSLNLK